MEQYHVTGNEYVSLPTIRERDGAVEGISCLYMGVRGMIEMLGNEGFVRPFLQCDGKAEAGTLSWQREHFWIPAFSSRNAGISFRCAYLAPIGERGFCLRLEAENEASSAHVIRIGVDGSWDETRHTVNEGIPLTMRMNIEKRSSFREPYAALSNCSASGTSSSASGVAASVSGAWISSGMTASVSEACSSSDSAS